MTSSEGTPGHPADPRLPVQPGSDGPVPRDWLREYDRSEAAKRLDRLAADQDLIITLALQNYEGPDYNIFETELSKYGIDVIIGWLRRASSSRSVESAASAVCRLRRAGSSVEMTSRNWLTRRWRRRCITSGRMCC